MSRYRGLLAIALTCAFISAGGLGSGLLLLGPILREILEPGGPTLPQQAAAYNAKDPVLEIPQWVVERLPEDAFQGVVILLFGVGLITIFGNIAGFFHEYLAATVSTRSIARLRLQVFRAALRQSLPTVMVRGSSEFVSRIVRDTVELQRGFHVLVSKSVTQVTKGAAAFLAAVIFEWRLVLVATLVAPILAIVLRKIGKRIRRGTRGALKAQEGLLRVTNEAVVGLRTVKVNTAEALALRRFHRENLGVLQEELRVRMARAIGSPLIETLALLVIIALAMFAAYHILDGKLPVSDFIMALSALGIAGASFKPMTVLINDIQAASAPAERLQEIFDGDQEPLEDERPQLLRHRRSIEFRNVTYLYSGASAPALNAISLTIQHGERVAIVGPNGCGKTTLLSMVPRLLEPSNRVDGGAVLIDNVDVAEVNLRSLRRQIAVVTQETILLRGTVRDNITFGQRIPSSLAVEQAAQRAHADTFIRELPQGMESPVAEHGASLSGGQRQRLAIARAILRDPAILILDEATSQIDAESEQQINAALNEFSRGRTTLIIAHRLSTVLAADRIVVMESGRIVDSGAHEELLGRCEVYRRLTSTQLLPATP